MKRPLFKEWERNHIKAYLNKEIKKDIIIDRYLIAKELQNIRKEMLTTKLYKLIYKLLKKLR
jgi:hypothetical protein